MDGMKGRGGSGWTGGRRWTGWKGRGREEVDGMGKRRKIR